MDQNTPEELVEAGRGYESLFVPMDEIPARLETLREFEEQSIIVYCRSGKRSLSVAAFLRKQGFDEVFSMAGGIIAWREAGFDGLVSK